MQKRTFNMEMTNAFHFYSFSLMMMSDTRAAVAQQRYEADTFPLYQMSAIHT